MPPPDDYIIKGTCYKSYFGGRTEVLVTIGSGAGTTQDIYIVSDGILAKSQTLTCYNLTQDSTYQNSKTITTSSTSGKYLLSCNNFTDGWDVGDVILIIATNYIDSNRDKQYDDFLNRFGGRIGAFSRLLVDEEGNEINHNNPLPVHITTETLDFLNAKKVITHGGPNRRISQIDWYYKGRHYRQIVTYSGDVTTHNAITEI